MRISDWSSDVCSSDLLTSITAWRDWESKRGQDPDFSNLDLLRRTAYNQRFKTFTQELRLQGRALDNRLDWLVGAYYSNRSEEHTSELQSLMRISYAVFCLKKKKNKNTKTK